jgi:hypothetical protein
MNRAYVISTTTALALGYAAGFSTDNITAKAAVDSARTEVVNATLSPGAKSTVENFVNANICPTVNTALELSGGDVCSAVDHAKRLCLDWSRRPGETERVLVSASISVPGSWTPGNPD